MQVEIEDKLYQFEIDLARDYGTLWHKGNELEGQLQDGDTLKELRKVLKNFKDEDIYIDIGAHIGFTSMLIDKGVCICFEPNPYAYNKLLTNMKLNNNTHIYAYNEAISNREFKYKIVTGQPTGMANIVEDINGEKTTLIGDRLFSNVDNIRLIKIDCENSNTPALKSLTETIKRNKPVLVLERNDDTKEMLKFLNYKAIKIMGDNVLCISEQ